jgi:isoleucyl-tRNA synthetase
VKELQGRFVKECDVDVVRFLAEKGLLYAKERYEHSYPFCWRCKSPLLYYATESWFIRTTAVKEQLIENNSRIEWYPGHLKEGRFGRFLEELVDWNISRNRYWGTPLNVWVCADCGKELSPGSRKELHEWAAEPVPEDLELHKPYVDSVKLRCSCGGLMDRTSEVIDVWFDSGSMPFAQYHYPFGDGESFREQYPADMICEGIDQTRGWFFSLLAISTLYNGHSPYKAVISTGHVLDENGLKMSKSKGNVIDPWEIIEEYGADAFRWAFLSDSAPWSSKRFSRQIVADAKSKVVDTLQNVHAFYALYAGIDGYRPVEHPVEMSHHDLDRWILSRLNTLLLQVEKGLEANDFLNPARLIEAFVDDLSNWYLRRSRERFWAEGLSADKLQAYQTLRQVLLTLARLTAPYMPFLAEELYGNLGGEGSVHLADYPRGDGSLSDPELEKQMETVRQVVELARNIRNETGLKTRQPLSRLLLVMEQPLSAERFGAIIREEINVKDIQVLQEDGELMDVTFKLNLKLAGKTYGPLVAPIQQALKLLTGQAARQVVKDGFVEVAVEDRMVRLPFEELLVEKKARDGLASASGYGITAALDTELTAELKEEGLVREVVRIIQDYRKKLELPIDKRVLLVLDADPELALALEHCDELLQESVLLAGVRFAREDGMEEFAVESYALRLKLE